MSLRPTIAWIVLACLVVSVAGCAQWGSKNKSREALSKTLDAEMAVATQTSKPKAATSSTATPAPVVSADQFAPEAEAKLTQPGTIAAASSTSGNGSPEYQALVAETLTRYKSLPDTTPEKYEELARTLQQGEPVPMLFLRQFNATLIRQLEQTATRADAVAPAYPETSLAHAVPPAKPVADAAANPDASESSTTTPSPAPSSDEAMPPAATTASAANIRQPSMADRVLYAKRTSPESAATGIFGGKVKAGANDATPASAETNVHTTHRPSSDLPEQTCSSEGDCHAEAATPPSLAEADVAKKAPDKQPGMQDAEETEPTPWPTQLADTIRALEHELSHGEPTPEAAARYSATLRILYLLADRKQDALRPTPGASADEEDYWNSQLHSLHLLLSEEGTPLADRRAALALRSLREAVEHLSAQATLDVTNIALCKEVSIWGSYQEFSKYEFAPDQEVLLYLELENFASESTPEGYATEFVTGYRVFDAAGRRLAEHDFPTASEVCRRRRHDYFLRYPMHIPRQLAPGEYTLQVTVEDQKAKKCGQRSVKFRVL